MNCYFSCKYCYSAIKALYGSGYWFGSQAGKHVEVSLSKEPNPWLLIVCTTCKSHWIKASNQ